PIQSFKTVRNGPPCISSHHCQWHRQPTTWASLALTLPDMCDVTVPIVLGALSLVPDSRYILLALASALVVVNIANARRPTQKLERTKHAINACKELLEGAKLTCPRDHVELTERARRLSEVEMSASRIQVQLLEKHPDFITWKGCVKYVKGMCDIWNKRNQCAKDVREIEKSTLLTIEPDNQRKSGENIRDCDEICDALSSQSSALNDEKDDSDEAHAPNLWASHTNPTVGVELSRPNTED
ncbi:hypothetical protein B0H14DRAFT_3767690, partial [Mycena olivaceomarginata]